MCDVCVIWDLPDDPTGNFQHIAEHGITQDEVEDVLLNPSNDVTVSRSSGEPLTFGYTVDGRYLAVVWELVIDDPLTVRPITAFDAPEPH
jgi:hypothetical protein